jgi:hypothetical protein
MLLKGGWVRPTDRPSQYKYDDGLTMGAILWVRLRPKVGGNALHNYMKQQQQLSWHVFD